MWALSRLMTQTHSIKRIKPSTESQKERNELWLSLLDPPNVMKEMQRLEGRRVVINLLRFTAMTYTFSNCSSYSLGLIGQSLFSLLGRC